jgi:hypothetical protein
MIIIPPGRCGSRRKPRLIDRWWAWYWGQPLDDLIRCHGYIDHDGQHYCGMRQKWNALADSGAGHE